MYATSNIVRCPSRLCGASGWKIRSFHRRLIGTHPRIALGRQTQIHDLDKEETMRMARSPLLNPGLQVQRDEIEYTHLKQGYALMQEQEEEMQEVMRFKALRQYIRDKQVSEGSAALIRFPAKERDIHNIILRNLALPLLVRCKTLLYGSKHLPSSHGSLTLLKSMLSSTVSRCLEVSCKMRKLSLPTEPNSDHIGYFGTELNKTLLIVEVKFHNSAMMLSIIACIDKRRSYSDHNRRYRPMRHVAVELEKRINIDAMFYDVHARWLHHIMTANQNNPSSPGKEEPSSSVSPNHVDVVELALAILRAHTNPPRGSKCLMVHTQLEVSSSWRDIGCIPLMKKLSREAQRYDLKSLSHLLHESLGVCMPYVPSTSTPRERWLAFVFLKNKNGDSDEEKTQWRERKENEVLQGFQEPAANVDSREWDENVKAWKSSSSVQDRSSNVQDHEEILSPDETSRSSMVPMQLIVLKVTLEGGASVIRESSAGSESTSEFEQDNKSEQHSSRHHLLGMTRLLRMQIEEAIDEGTKLIVKVIQSALVDSMRDATWAKLVPGKTTSNTMTQEHFSGDFIATFENLMYHCALTSLDPSLRWLEVFNRKHDVNQRLIRRLKEVYQGYLSEFKHGNSQHVVVVDDENFDVAIHIKLGPSRTGACRTQMFLCQREEQQVLKDDPQESASEKFRASQGRCVQRFVNICAQIAFSYS